MGGEIVGVTWRWGMMSHGEECPPLEIGMGLGTLKVREVGVEEIGRGLNGQLDFMSGSDATPAWAGGV